MPDHNITRKITVSFFFNQGLRLVSASVTIVNIVLKSKEKAEFGYFLVKVAT